MAVDAAALLSDTKRLVRDVVADLHHLVDVDPDAAAVLDREWQAALASGRTGHKQAEWREGYLGQVAVAWVLGSVFVRFCEDNGLVDDPLLAGPGGRLATARDHRAAYLRANPADDDRHWLAEVIRRYRRLPALGDLFGGHNPLWVLSPSADGARLLVEFWWRLDDAGEQLRHDFTDPLWDTRFLGDLYQDLSEHAKKNYALLQTPHFVEEFILDRTLDPAIDTFGLAATKLIDPTCGSGHFLLGAFARILRRWRDREPATNVRTLIQYSLDAVYGVDLNPFAVAVARFRLLVEALRAEGVKRLADAPGYRINLAVGDSLLHGDPPDRMLLDDAQLATQAHHYRTEDGDLARRFLEARYEAVVGNPPYITVKDPALRDRYRDRFTTCRGKYSLGVPFTELFWHLAVHQPQADRCGYVGLITANSFMKREFGKDLIEKWFPTTDITHVIDTSGAYIPGHGTPTVILFGRNRAPIVGTVRAVMGIRGEPTRPADAAKGVVWTSISDLVDRPGAESPFVSVVDLPRDRLAKHPWSIGGGGAAELRELLDQRRNHRIGEVASSIGIVSFTLEDDAFLVTASAASTLGLRPDALRPMVEGDRVRDWSVAVGSLAVFPYDEALEPAGDSLPEAQRRHLWRCRRLLETNRMFGGKTKVETGLHWTEYGRFTASKVRTPLSIVFAFVATHNHFVLDRGGKVFNRTAPVIKLPVGASVDEHLALVGVLNSSAACFWMQQTFHNKGGPGGGSSKDEKWHDFYEFDGTKLQQFPVPAGSALAYGRLLDGLAVELASVSAGAVIAREVPSAVGLAAARRRFDELRRVMIAAQEELDWHAYRLYGLVDEDLTYPVDEVPSLGLAERAFEIVLARKVEAGDEETQWFSRNGITPITEVPAHWPVAYRRLVERRVEMIEGDLNIGLIEKPEHKRRWNTESWDAQQERALRTWLLDRLEAPQLWAGATLQSCAQLADAAARDPEFRSVAALYTGSEGVDLTKLVTELVSAEAVPYLAAWRYTDDGLRKHAEWLRVWELQRAEDRGESTGEIPVPPRYLPKDFRAGCWSHRGKLDVPKERFIAYPGAARGADPTPVVGWAGWDHAERARALAGWVMQARYDGADAERLVPLLAGLAELVPWLRQWHNDPSPDPMLDRIGDQIDGLVRAEAQGLGLTVTDLVAWRPPATANKRGRPRKEA